MFRLVYSNAEPRSAGIGNRVNCGVAISITPAGAMNAGQTEAAYQEAAAVALAAFRYSNGDFLKTLRASVCYRRDCDSIAGIMACGLFGVFFGGDPFPKSLAQTLEEVNRRDFTALADSFVQTVYSVHGRDTTTRHPRDKVVASQARKS
ncbi:MAG: ADP-ribosylglycohydrolase family protein [Opitutales bacterium]|nr:ADP-ribosylglycohydrolase family protein [Opitutales bacterium]